MIKYCKENAYSEEDEMIDVLKLGAEIKNLRRGKGLTQQAFAQELHVSFQAVSNWERGVAPPTLIILCG